MTKQKYNTNDIAKCEYKDSMIKSCCTAPKLIKGKCFGFHNKYNNATSQVCKKCENYIGDDYRMEA